MTQLLADNEKIRGYGNDELIPIKNSDVIQAEINAVFQSIKGTYFPRMKWTLVITEQTNLDYDYRYDEYMPYGCLDRTNKQIRVHPLCPKDELEKMLIHMMAAAVTSGGWQLVKRMGKVAAEADSIGRTELASVIRDHVANMISQHEGYVLRWKRMKSDGFNAKQCRKSVVGMVKYQTELTNKIPTYWETLNCIQEEFDVYNAVIMDHEVKDLRAVYEKAAADAKGLLINQTMRPSELRELMEVRETDRLGLLMKRKLNDGLMPASTIVDDSMIKTCENCNDSRVWYGKNSMGWERNGCYPACCHHLADDEELHVCNHEVPGVVCDQWLPEGTKTCYNCGIQENCLLRHEVLAWFSVEGYRCTEWEPDKQFV